jgi:hypothetical protein
VSENSRLSLVRGSAIIEASVADEPVMLVYAAISPAMGIAMVRAQRLVRRRAARGRYAGWMDDPRKRRGASVFVPDAVSQMFEQTRYAEYYHLYLAAALVVGLYPTWSGFTAARVEP